MTFYKMILHSLAHQILKTKTNKRKQKTKQRQVGQVSSPLLPQRN